MEVHDEAKGPLATCFSSLTPLVLMIALSTHSVFEGIAVGLVTEWRNLWSFFIAILLPQWAAGLSLGISMSKNMKGRFGLVFWLLLIFSLATPLGVLIGILVSESSDMVSVVFDALAGGTFIYIAASEVVVEEFSTPDRKWLKLFMFLLGAGIITGVSQIE